MGRRLVTVLLSLAVLAAAFPSASWHEHPRSGDSITTKR
jgi:hypothetical protein